MDETLVEAVGKSGRFKGRVLTREEIAQE